MDELTMLCSSWQKSWYNDYPEYALNYTNEDPVAIEANPGCHYPDFLPVCYHQRWTVKVFRC
jgi:hypothetical protein